MKTITKILLFVLLFCMVIPAIAQQFPQPYTAKAYWAEKNRQHYIMLKNKQLKNEMLTKSELTWIAHYEQYLMEYFNKMNEAEKENYQKTYTQWNKEAGVEETINMNIEETTRDPGLLIKHIAYSGVSGASYGIMLTQILEMEGAGLVGFPILLSGVSMMTPVYSKRYEQINNNSLWLRSHGKVVGSGGGLALGALIFGDHFMDDEYWVEGSEDTKTGQQKPTLLLSLVASLGLGELGFHLGKTRKWSEGRASMYQYYGYYTPAVTTTLMASAEITETRLYGASTMLSAGAGYLMANKIMDRFEYTRGDVGALVGLNAIGTTFGIGLIIHAESEEIKAALVPTATSVASHLWGHYMLRDMQLSRPQGRRVNYAAIGGGLIGMGLTVMIEPDNPGYFATIPSITALGGYLIMLDYYRKNSDVDVSFRNNNQKFNISYQLHPESYFYNKMSNGKFISPYFNVGIRF